MGGGMPMGGMGMPGMGGGKPAKLKMRDSKAEFPIHAAAREGDHEALGKLLEADAAAGGSSDRLNALDDHNMSPLAWTAKRGDAVAAAMLLEKGAAVDEANGEDATSPLLAAAAKGNDAVIRVLIQHQVMGWVERVCVIVRVSTVVKRTRCSRSTKHCQLF